MFTPPWILEKPDVDLGAQIQKVIATAYRSYRHHHFLEIASSFSIFTLKVCWIDGVIRLEIYPTSKRWVCWQSLGLQYPKETGQMHKPCSKGFETGRSNFSISRSTQQDEVLAWQALLGIRFEQSEDQIVIHSSEGSALFHEKEEVHVKGVRETKVCCFRWNKNK